MIREIDATQLLPGMYIHELHCSWMQHPFMHNQFLLEEKADIRKIREAGIKRISIDTDKGIDIPETPGPDAVETTGQPRANQETPAKPPISDIGLRIGKAKMLVKDASGIIKNIMADVRAGKQVDMSASNKVVSSITHTLSRDPHTLLGVARLKTKDEYTFMHSVSVAALLTAFANSLDFTPGEVDQIAMGGLLHDIGKALTPNNILNKPGKLTNDEFVVMRQHAIERQNHLLQGCDLPQLALDVICMHHERPDGRGYPLGLKGEQLSQAGRMAAIVDIYDALTSVRVYKKAWEPSMALKSMLEWCPEQLDRPLLERFIKMLGIYPVGALVALDNDEVGIVIQQGEDLLRPVVKLIYDARQSFFIPAREVDLKTSGNLSIKCPVTPEKYRIDLADFM